MTSQTGPARPIAVFDIDGVLADVRHRLHLLEAKPKRWAEFFALADRDGVLPAGVELLRALEPSHEVRYLTGRPEATRALTRQWLAASGLPPARLAMRPDRDHRPARIFKRELLREWIEQGDTIGVVVDDDPRVIQVIDDLGLTVVQATWQDSDASAQEALWDAQERLGLT